MLIPGIYIIIISLLYLHVQNLGRLILSHYGRTYPDEERETGKVLDPAAGRGWASMSIKVPVTGREVTFRSRSAAD